MQEDRDLAALDMLEAAWKDVDEAQALREAADEKRQAALQRVQDALVTLALQIGDNQELRDRMIQHLYWMEPDIKPTWLAEAFSLKPHQICDIAGTSSIPLACPRCGIEYSLIVTSRAHIQEIERRIRRNEPALCADCYEVDLRSRSQRAERERSAQLERLHQLRTMPYLQYLVTPEWRARREQQLQRAGYRCQVCNTNRAALNVHHRTYERRGNESFKDLVVLCRDCHSIFHREGKLARDTGD